MLSTSAIVKRKVLFERVASIFETWFVIRFWGGELTVLSFAYSLSFLLFFFLCSDVEHNQPPKLSRN